MRMKFLIEAMKNCFRSVISFTVDGAKSIMLAVKNYTGKTVFGLAFTASKEIWSVIFNKHFSDGKKASDFVSMITNGAFCCYALFLVHRDTISDEADGPGSAAPWRSRAMKADT